jgi:hypothetical protein
MMTDDDNDNEGIASEIKVKDSKPKQRILEQRELLILILSPTYATDQAKPEILILTGLAQYT